MKRGVFGLDRFKNLDKEWRWLDAQTIDKYVSREISTPGILIALSSQGLHSGRKMQSLVGKYICDRGSSHILFQNQILAEEYKKWGFEWKGIDPRIIGKEEAEYDEADIITIPSEFARATFMDKGIDQNKLVKIPYGARLDRFKKVGHPDKNRFSVLWVGGVSLRKGFMYALEAFKAFRHPNKEFTVIGSLTPEIKALLASTSIENVIFKGNLPNDELINYFNSANAFLLSSIEEGLAMVMGEAMACGCPVIASTNTGASDLFTDSKEGFIVPIRDVEAIIERFKILSDTPSLREEMGENALMKVQSMGGWDTYGDLFKNLLVELNNSEQ